MVQSNKPIIPAAIERRIKDIPTEKSGSLKLIKGFGIFIDTHRDQPHVGSFFEDIHRGECRPTLVDYVVGEDLLVEPETGKTLARHDKHMFVEEDWYQEWLMNWLAEHGTLPTNDEGVMVTSHLRDPRAQKYLLKSFRQIVVSRYNRK